MKTYTITVNGTVYNVTVEEGAGNAAPVAQAAPAPAPVAAAPAAAPAPVPAPTPAPAPAAPAAQGSITVNAPMPGKILDVKISVGQAVKRGETILILEAMKMENDIVAPSDGTVASVNVTVGNAVNAGDVLATLN